MFHKKKRLLERIEFLEAENKKLFELAYFDNLTKTYNRNWLVENICSDSSEYKLIVVDINGLKKINDRDGHLEGDSYLVTVSNKLKKFGKVIRYGGDEFILIVPLDFDEKTLDDFRYCYGCATKVKGKEFNIAFEEADKKLYCKKLNRNR